MKTVRNQVMYHVLEGFWDHVDGQIRYHRNKVFDEISTKVENQLDFKPARNIDE